MARICDSVRWLWAFAEPWTGFARLGCALIGKLKAAVAFGPIRQGAGAVHNGKLSWLHLEIAIKTPFPWEEKRIRKCEVKIRFYNLHDAILNAYDLRWRSRDSLDARGIARTTLDYGHPELVPIVARYTGDEQDKIAVYGQNIGRLTDESFLVHRRDFHDFNPGTYRFKLVLSSGVKQWESGFYKLIVPVTTADVPSQLLRPLFGVVNPT